MEVNLQHVTNVDGIDRLVRINHDAMVNDPLFNWMGLYTESTEDEGTRAALLASVDDPSYKIVRAVAVEPLAPEIQQVVGFVQYFRGIIELPKNSDSKGDFQKAQSKDLPPANEEEGKAARLEVGDRMYVHTRNFYINTVRHQRHQCRQTNVSDAIGLESI